MSEFNWINATLWAIGLMGLIFAIYVHFKNQRDEKRANEKFDIAEKEAFQNVPFLKSIENINEEILELQRQHLDAMSEKYTYRDRGSCLIPTKEEEDEARDMELNDFIKKTNKAFDQIKEIKENLPSLEMNRLFNVNSKRIEKYQVQTRARATWSFMFAIFSMFAGLGFVVWGGSKLLSATEPIVLAAGGIISAIGGGVGGYITKTFLDVHKLSLNQLNRYFKQPVINDHILMAQRLDNISDDPETKKKAYETVINSIAELIKQETDIKKE